MAGAVAVLATGCATRAPTGPATPAGAPPADAVIVHAKGNVFTPKDLTISAGQTVAWKFEDGSIAHNVVGEGWKSPEQTSGYYSHIFPVPGTYRYRCTLHAAMKAQVVVRR